MNQIFYWYWNKKYNLYIIQRPKREQAIATKTPKPDTHSTNETYQKDEVNMDINSTILEDGFESQMHYPVRYFQ